MYSKGENRTSVSFRLSKSQLELLDDYTRHFNQGRGELIREAIQSWLNKQELNHPLPNSEVRR